MKEITENDIQDVINSATNINASIYVWGSRESIPAKLKNAIRKFILEMKENGIDSPELIERFEVVLNTDFFKSYTSVVDAQLAIFISENNLKVYKLPKKVEDFSSLNRSFQIKPLTSFLIGNKKFMVLSLHKDHLRLYSGNEYHIEEISSELFPKELSYVLERKKELPDQTLLNDQRKKPKTDPHSIGDKLHAIETEELSQFFKSIDHALKPMLDHEKPYLILAGLDSYFPIYKKVSTYARLVDRGIAGNSESKPIVEIHRAAWEIIRPMAIAQMKKACEKYLQAEKSAKTSEYITTILRASHQGKIDTLFLPVGYNYWGRYNEEYDSVHFQPEPHIENEDILNKAAINTLNSGGKVFTINKEYVPSDSGVAAVMRY